MGWGVEGGGGLHILMLKSWLIHKELREDRYGRGLRFKKGSQARSRTKDALELKIELMEGEREGYMHKILNKWHGMQLSMDETNIFHLSVCFYIKFPVHSS